MEAAQTIKLTHWLNLKAMEFEKKREFREAAHYLSLFLRRLTKTARTEEVDVAQLADVHYRLGMAHRGLKDTSKSMYHLKYSIRLNSSEPRYYEAYGRAYLTSGHWRVAKTQFEKAIQLQPKNTTYLRQYAWVLLMMGRKEEAKKYSERALELAPKSREGKWTLVRVYMESNLYVQAWALLKKMQKSTPHSMRLFNLLQECESQLETTFEGMVLKILRRGMKADGDPFSLLDLKLAEEFWVEHCLKMVDRPLTEVSSPYRWAAAVCWYVAHKRQILGLESEEIFERFAVHSSDVWPCLKRLQGEAAVEVAS